MDTHLCEIEKALGRARECPGALCPFWQDGQCVVAGLRADLLGTAGLAELLMGVRTRLDDAQRMDRALPLPGLR